MMDSTAKRNWEGGIKEGVDLGRVEGRTEAKAEDLTRLLQRRFNGDLTSKIQQRITDASIEELDAWLDRIIDAPSLEAVFKKRPGC